MSKTIPIALGLTAGLSIVMFILVILTAQRVSALEKKVARFEEVLNP